VYCGARKERREVAAKREHVLLLVLCGRPRGQAWLKLKFKKPVGNNKTTGYIILDISNIIYIHPNVCVRP